MGKSTMGEAAAVAAGDAKHKHKQHAHPCVKRDASQHASLQIQLQSAEKAPQHPVTNIDSLELVKMKAVCCMSAARGTSLF
jgi:hypothetical protein